MGLALLIAIVCVPFVEIYLAIQVAHQIGGPATIALLIVLSASGPWLVKRQGIGVWRRTQARVAAGEVPGRELTDGVFLLVAGLLLTVPGFLTAAVGILLLLPPVRAVLRATSGLWFGRRLRRTGVSIQTYSDGRWRESSGPETDGQPGAIDAAAHESPARRRLRSGGDQ